MKLFADLETSCGESPVGVILGSGLGAAAVRLLNAGGRALSFSDVPGMPRPHVAGHHGRIVAGRAGRVPVIMLQGRVHTYEGHPAEAITFGVRLLADQGIRRLIVSNAAGGIRDGFRPGDLMLIRDHIRLTTHWSDTALFSTASAPRAGQIKADLNDSEGLSAVRAVWDTEMRQQARALVTPLTVHDGVYAMMPGPNYETPAEVRMLRALGADAVGMSTIPEALTARALGIRVLGVSCITNIAAGLSSQTLSHQDVTSTASAVQTHFVDWLWSVLQRF